MIDRRTSPFAALVATLLAFGYPSIGFAQTPPPDRDAVAPLGASCHGYNAARRFADSLPFCILAAQAYRQKDQTTADNGLALFAQADMLTFAAADRAGLGQHKEAVQTVLAARQLVVYIGGHFSLTEVERSRLVALARHLQKLQTNESSYAPVPTVAAGHTPRY